MKILNYPSSVKQRISGIPVLIVVILMRLSLASVAVCEEWPPSFIRSKIAVTPGGYHSTTRGTIRLVFPHHGRWLVFRGDPNTYHFSGDGLNWTAVESEKAGRSHIIEGDTIYSIYSTLVEPEPVWKFDHFIARGDINVTHIDWEEPVKLDTRASYYPDLKRDSRGFFSFTGRAVIRNDEGTVVNTEVLNKRSSHPGDITCWEPDVRCISTPGQVFGKGNEWKRIGSTAHENLVLENGRSMVFGMMTVDWKGMLYAASFNGEKWDNEIVLSRNMSTWAGTDRRMCAVFDSEAKKIHLIYVDGVGRLWYRSAETPYTIETWSEPVKLHPFKTFTAVVSLDTSQTPAHLYLVYGKTIHEDKKDLRNTYGELYLQRFDGESWSESALVSEPGTTDNWYPNMNEDVSSGIGILYLRGSRLTREGEKPLLDILFTSTGPPSEQD